MSELEKAGNPEPENKVMPDVLESKEQEDIGFPDSEKTVKYESLLREKRRAQSEKARAQSEKARADKLASELELAMQSKLEAEGNLAESNERLKKQVADLSDKNKKLYGNFAYNSLLSQVEAEAAKLGCIDTGVLGKLMDLSNFDVDTETFKADLEMVKSAIEDQKKSRPYLFNKSGPKINSSNPNAEFAIKKKAIADMSVDEQRALAREIDKAEGKNLGWKQ